MLSDENSRLEALDPTQSFIVQAPAGSGKTYLLVQRFIKLLATCSNPEECVAITFTKKAAFEMRYRVLQTIEQQNLAHDLENNIYQRIIINPSCLKILTIDAFCAALIEKMPISSKLGIDIKVTEDPQTLYVAAVEQFFKTSCQNNELAKDLVIILNHLNGNYNTITALLVTMLAKREQWLPVVMPLKYQYDINLKQQLDLSLKIIIQEILQQALDCLPHSDYINKLLYIASQAAVNLRNSGVQSNIIFCAKLIDTWPKATIEDLAAWRGLAELLLNKDGSPRMQVGIKQGFLAVSSIKNSAEKKNAELLKKDMQEILAYLAKNGISFLQKLYIVTLLPDPNYLLDDWQLMQSLFNLLPQLVAHLMVIFQEEQQVDFTQVAIAAVDALGDEIPTDLALLLDCKIQHILVDEFQDTSILQFQLLAKLISNWQANDGRTIFLVGDPMQSIYSFRQADVRLFLIVQQYGIANIKLKNLYLTTNFRASSILIDYLNKLFINIFPKYHDETLGGVCYSLSHASNISNIKYTATNSKIKFFIASDFAQEANNILSLIQHIQAENPANHSIAILVRAKSHANLIIAHLKTAGIKVQPTDLELLADQIIINDLIVLTKAILHVNDIIAWLALLKSPLVGLKLADLHALFENIEGPLLKILSNYKNNKILSLDAKIRLDYVLPVLLQAVEHKDNVQSLSKLIKKVWLRLGGNLLVTGPELAVVEEFFYALLTLDNINNINAIEQLVNKKFVNTRPVDIDLNSVHIMTIHKAKGLEFDSVILPGMSNKIVTFDPQLLLWREIFSKKTHNKSILFATAKSANYNFIKYCEQQSDLYEEQRLLYVAITRAKQNFYGFCNNINNNQKNNFFNFLKPYVLFEEINEISCYSESSSINREYKAAKYLKRIPTAWYVGKCL